MKKENIKWTNQCGGRMVIAAVMTTMVLCMGCSGKGQEVDGAEDTSETTALFEEVTQQEQGTGAEDEKTETTGQESVEVEDQETESEEPAEPETAEDDEWTALYNDYKDQPALDFTVALCESGYEEICLVNGDYLSTTYFSVKDGNYYTIPEEYTGILVYVPYTPADFSCDNENISMYYMYKMMDDPIDNYINSIQLACTDFEGDDVPVNISVTFEDGSTQEITVYLTRHAE